MAGSFLMPNGADGFSNVARRTAAGFSAASGRASDFSPGSAEMDLPDWLAVWGVRKWSCWTG